MAKLLNGVGGQGTAPDLKIGSPQSAVCVTAHIEGEGGGREAREDGIGAAGCCFEFPPAGGEDLAPEKPGAKARLGAEKR
jgi:hypothetical protein